MWATNFIYKPRWSGSNLTLCQTLQEQGVVGKAVTLSCTSVPTDVFAAWHYIQRLLVPDENLLLEGGDEDSRYFLWRAFATSQKSWTACCWQSIQPELAKSEISKRSSKLDPWHLARISAKAWKEWTFHVIFKAWHLAVISTKAWKELTFHVIFEAWHLAVISAKVWKELTFHVIFKAWHLAAILTKALKEWNFHVFFEAWNLARSSTKAWKEWNFHVIFEAWHLAVISAKVWKEWSFHVIFKAWHLAVILIKA